MTAILQTTRTALREFEETDLGALAAMVADEDQMGFYPRPKTRDEASAWIERNLTLYQAHGFDSGSWSRSMAGSSSATAVSDRCPLTPRAKSKWDGTYERSSGAMGWLPKPPPHAATFMTEFGPFDISFVPDGTDGYDDLQQNSQVVERLGLKIPVASIADITRSKRAAGREKDAAHLLVLIDFLEKQERGGDSDR